MDIIRTLLIFFFAGIIGVLFAILTGIWPLAVIVAFTLIFVGIYLQPKADKKWAEFKKKYIKDRKYEVMELTDDSNIPSVEYPDEEEIQAYESETGRTVGALDRARMKTRKPGRDVDTVISQYMELFRIDKKRASILLNGGYRSIDDFENATVADLASLEGISPTVARKIVARLNA